MTRLLVTLFAVWFTIPRAAAAEPVSVFDRVPTTARVVLGIRSIDELKAKGEKFLKAVEWEPQYKPTQLFELLMTFTGLGAAPDPKQGIAFVLVAEEFVIPKGGWFGDLQLVAIFPFVDKQRLADQFRIDPKQFKEGDLYHLDEQNNIAKFLTVRDGFVYVGESEKGVESVAKSKRVVDELSPEQKKAFAASDVFLTLHPNGFDAEQRKTFVRDLANALVNQNDALADTEAARDFREACEFLKFGVASFQVDDGFSVRLAGIFEKHEKTKKFLSLFRSGTQASDLDGLPEGKLLFGQAVQGDGNQTAAFARGFLNALLNSHETTRQLMAQNDQAIYLGVFTEIWKQLKGTRMGLYLNDDPAKHGLLSGLAIVETDDAGAFVKELRRLAKFSVSENQKVLPKDEVAEIEKLIRDLGSERFRVRESATSKLMLIGLPAIHYLDKAIKGGDADLALRATKVRESIATTLEARRKEPLSKESILPLRPMFGFVEKPTPLQGVDVETLVIRMTRDDETVKKELKQLFGPTWDRVRVAPLGKQTVFLFGSNEALFSTTLTNLKEKKPGLGKASFLPDFHKHSAPNRKMEVHFSIHRLSGLMNGDLIRFPKTFGEGTVTSVGLTVTEDSLQFDGWLPIPEFKAFRKSQGW